MGVSKRTRTALFDGLLLATDLAVSMAVAASLAFLVSPGLPWLIVFGLLEGAYLAFTACCLLRGTAMILRRIKAFPLDLTLHPGVAEALLKGRATGSARPPALLRSASLSINTLGLGREGDGCLVLTDGALDDLGRGEMRVLLAREAARMRSGDAAIWSTYARLSLAPTLFSGLVGKKGPASRIFFFSNVILMAVFWLGLLLATDGPGGGRIMLVVGMPSLMVIATLLTNLLASLPLLGLLRTVDWRTRELAADREAADLPGGMEAMASIFERVEGKMPETGMAAFDTGAWVGPIKLRKSYFVNPEAWFHVKGWNPQPSLGQRRDALGIPSGDKPA